jgi:hypothetical protein
MKRYLLILLGGFLLFAQSSCVAEERNARSEKAKKPSFLLLIAEQNIEGPQRCWWASEVDLSTVEAKLSGALIATGYSVLSPSQLSGILRREKAFRRINISEEESVKLAKLSRADFVILGKAVASSGANVPDSNMRSCFANATVKLIRAGSGEIIAYLDAAGSSAHMDVISGGREALVKAAEDLAVKVVNVLEKKDISKGGAKE